MSGNLPCAANHARRCVRQKCPPAGDTRWTLKTMSNKNLAIRRANDGKPKSFPPSANFITHHFCFALFRLGQNQGGRQRQRVRYVAYVTLDTVSVFLVPSSECTLAHGRTYPLSELFVYARLIGFRHVFLACERAG